MEIAQTADHALRILLSIAEDGPDNVAQLSTRLGLARTVTQRLVVTLQQRGFVAVSNGRVEIGSTVFGIADKALPGAYRAAQPILEQLAREVGETTVISVLDGTDSLVVAVGRSDAHPLRVEYRLGFRHPASIGAAGRAILFNLPDARAAEILAAQGAGGTTVAFDQQKAQGVAVSRDELRLGAHGIAVPVIIAQRPASLSIVAPANRTEALDGQAEALKAAAAELALLG
jgi:DNA-binding IclR family transcriptional regulator